MSKPSDLTIEALEIKIQKLERKVLDWKELRMGSTIVLIAWLCGCGLGSAIDNEELFRFSIMMSTVGMIMFFFIAYILGRYQDKLREHEGEYYKRAFIRNHPHIKKAIESHE